MIDPARLGPLLRDRRQSRGWSLRRAADEIGVQFNTIARVEAGHLPDLDNYRRIVAWLGGSAEEATEAQLDTVEAIKTHLSHDPALRPDDAQRIARMVRDMYDALARPQQVGAVHLRSAPTLKPVVGTLLGELLDDMRRRLETDAAS
jgi:transcriptional regulator with XRE-family HTH domain